MAEREVKAPATGPTGERKRAVGETPGLVGEAGAAVVTDRGVGDPVAIT
jgi:hypothetical protein